MQRLKRIGIPLVAGCVTIMPLIAIIVITADLLEAAEVPPLWILPLIGLFDMGHLWFLWYLLLMAAGFVGLAKLGLQFRHPVLWWLTLPSALVFELLMQEPVFGPDSIFGVYIPALESEVALLPNPILLAYYSLYFCFGAFFYRHGFVIRRWWMAAIIPAVPVFLAGMHFLYHDPENPDMLISAPFQTAYAWLMCFGMLGLFRWLFARESFWVRYFSDSSYWIYLAHVPLVMVGHLLVTGLPVHFHLKFLLVCGGVTLFLLAAYQIGVRYTFVGRGLNGPRQPRERAAAPTPAA